MTTNPKRSVRLRGVRVHNLKGIDLDLPLDRLVVLTGVSGSGKSSLAFDTLYAEGQRRYVETFSPYARQFLDRVAPPDADRIEGVPPAIAVSQNAGVRSARSTVGSVTDVHDYLGLVFARAGRVLCLDCGEEVRPADPESVARAIDELPDGSRYLLAFPVDLRPETDRAALASALRSSGFVRVRIDGVVSELGPESLAMASAEVDVIVDRLVRGTEAARRRLDSIETAFGHGLGRLSLITDDGDRRFYRGWRCGRCGRDYPEPDPRLFSYNSPLGACPSCEGFGRVIDLDLDRILPDRSLSIADGAVAPWRSPGYLDWNQRLLDAAPRLGVPTDVPIERWTAEQITRVVDGAGGFPGIRGFFRWLEKKSYKMHVRVFLSRWRGYRTCDDCGGKRLRPESLAVQVDGVDFARASALTIRESLEWLSGVLEAQKGSRPVANALGPALARLGYLEQIGLGYLTLDRPARSLSGGESQRVALTGALGSGLVNTLYVLDEPTRGLHPRDVGRLIAAMGRLRDAGNSVVVVEHDTTVMRAADWLVDIGPGAGESGGRLLYSGPPEGVERVEESATGRTLAGGSKVAIPASRRSSARGHLTLSGASGRNLKGIDVSFPLGLLCVVAGVSGSGKSTLIEETLYPALAKLLRGENLPSEPFAALSGMETLGDVTLMDQSTFGRSARSNPATYLDVFDEIRKTFAATHEAKARNYSAGRFSFNREGGRCNACEGNGTLAIDMQFLSDVVIVCPECRGTRYRPETLEVTYRGKNIAEVLDMTAREALGFFRHRPKVLSRLRPLMDAGLDYLRLGQPTSTLSGGEAQRLKLAEVLSRSSLGARASEAAKGTLFLFDEPTSGLHPADVSNLLDCLNRLLDLGHSVIVVEHHPGLLLAADWIVELGPEAGTEGGRIVAQGTPEEVAKAETPTGKVLADWFTSGP